MPKITPPDFSDHSNQVIAAWICEQFNALEARVAELEEAAKAPTPAVRAAAEAAEKKTSDAKADQDRDDKERAEAKQRAQASQPKYEPNKKA